MKFIPNTLTLFNLFCGFAGIIFVFFGKMEYVIYTMGCSLLFDFLDGFLARALKATSKIGIELDSLADVVSFGLLPSTIIFTQLLWTLSKTDIPFVQQIFISLSAGILVCASALRLARYNVNAGTADYFHGLPTPAAAIAVLSFTFFTAEFQVISFGFWILITLLISILQVSNVRMLSFKVLFKTKIGIFLAALAILALMLGMLVFGWWISVLFLPGYLLASMIYFVFLQK